ncbi:hypothetical protein [Kordiimonas sp.]|uniref:hypothetical protein n=1 Tax=Kordiimonas sp. TaxID=1970157 RepID=UPI003A92D3FE
MPKTAENRRIPSLIALRWLIYISIIVVIAPILWMWLDPNSYSYLDTNVLVEKYGGFERLEPWQRVLGFIVTLIPGLLFSMALWSLLPLIRSAESGNWFNISSEHYCIKAGKLLLWHAFANWISQTLLVLVLTANNSPGERILMMAVRSGDLLGLIPALMALAIAHMMRVGREQREELNEIV